MPFGRRRSPVSLLALSIIVVLTASGPSDAQTNFNVKRVAPHVFVETKLSGEQINWQGVQAVVEAGQGATIEQMTAVAKQLFAEHLRALAGQNEKSKHVWITFETGTEVINGETQTKTWRAIFLREDGIWKRLGE